MAQPQTDQPYSKLDRTRKEVDEVKDIMVQNVDKLLDQGEKLKDVERKADDLAAESQLFHQRSRALKRQMWLKNAKLIAIIVVISVIVVGIIIAAICGSGHCKK